MSFPSYELSFDGRLLTRGFWVYVWRVEDPLARLVVHYVGRTGDSSSANAGSPFSRMSAHLGRNTKGNALRRNLVLAGLTPERSRFSLLALGPLFLEQSTLEAHRLVRDRAAAIEAALAAELRKGGFRVLGNHPRERRMLAEDAERLRSIVDQATAWIAGRHER